MVWVYTTFFMFWGPYPCGKFKGSCGDCVSGEQAVMIMTTTMNCVVPRMVVQLGWP